MKQITNPYLPIDEYVPDGEPHIFGDRIYVYGSHDKEAGEKFCQLDYVVWSAPVNDLTDWRWEGVSYRATQDPGYGTEGIQMYAPDVAQGNDGRYYLYYAMAGITFTAPIHVAVSDSPAGPFTYYGPVCNPDGSVFTRNITFDPGVINDNGRIWLYYGWSLRLDPGAPDPKTPEGKEWWIQKQVAFFDKSEEEVRTTPGSIMGANVVELEEDMRTVKGPVKRIVPGPLDAQGTSFEGHAFFEASSIRKIGEVYYYIYSSENLHELCYATSKYPDRDFVYGGALVSNGDIGVQGRAPEHAVAAIGNDHGSIVNVNGKWYIFYHRQTHAHSFSRQGCAEELQMTPDGRFLQSEMTSCGLNGGPLAASGTYSAMIACQLYRDNMPYTDLVKEHNCPYLTNTADQRYATNIRAGTRIGFKYFAFTGAHTLGITYRGDAEGTFSIRTDSALLAAVSITPRQDWGLAEALLNVQGKQALYLDYEGTGAMDLLEISFY